MVLGNVYVALTHPMPDTSAMVFHDMELKGVQASGYNAALRNIKKNGTSLYDASFARGKVSAKINMVFYLVCAILIGLYNYFHTKYEDRDFSGQMGTPIVIALLLCCGTYVFNFIESLAMWGYRSVLSQLLTQCGDKVGSNEALRQCFSAYRANQARLRAAQIQANATRDSGMMLSSALGSFRQQ